MAEESTGPDGRAVAEVVVAALRSIVTSSEARAAAANIDLADAEKETILIGPGALIDSMGLVTLIVELEQRLEEEFGLVVTLADERAMSRSQSPFRTVRSLVDHVQRAAAGQAACRTVESS